MTGIVAGFGFPLGDARMGALVGRGFTLIRQDLQTCDGRTPDVQAVLEECSRWPSLRPLYIVTPDTLTQVPEGAWVELRNEPEYLTPAAYAAELRAVWAEVQRRTLTLWAGGIGNTDRDSLSWLRQVLSLAPFVTHVSVHRYSADAAQTWSKPHKGFDSRLHEVSDLQAIIGARPYLVSEVGFHTARTRRWWFWTRQLTPAQQTARLRAEIAFWQQHGAQAVIVYQENDAPGTTQDKYGLRDAGGQWKDAARW